MLVVHAFTHRPPAHAKPTGQSCVLQSSTDVSEHAPSPVAGSARHRAFTGQSRLVTHSTRQRPIAHTNGAAHSDARVQYAPVGSLA
jgi:hypothetical protein